MCMDKNLKQSAFGVIFKADIANLPIHFPVSMYEGLNGLAV